jgi:general L-amino acid transport system permease protein
MNTLSSTGVAPSAPRTTHPAIAWARANLFSSWGSTVITLVGAYVILRFGIGFISWAVFNAHWSANEARQCLEDKWIGACWSFVSEKNRFILFGTYPYDEQWRPLLAVLVLVALYVVSTWRRLWNWRLAVIWVGALGLFFLLMWGGVLGMQFVEQERWGGMPLTLILATLGIVFAFPLSILLALGRRSHMPAIKAVCIGFIEVIRGVPLVSLLFMASVMFPLFLPSGVTIDKLLRAQVAIIMFAAAYMAEVVRGGLQAIPKGQYEAADALGLSYWHSTLMIVLPQALRLVIPPLVNVFIALFKDTSLVVIIGLFDLATTTKIALQEPQWRSFGVEAYLYLALLYFVFCFAMSKYSQHIEHDLARYRRR